MRRRRTRLAGLAGLALLVSSVGSASAIARQPNVSRLDVVLVDFRRYLGQFDFTGDGAAVEVTVTDRSGNRTATYAGPTDDQVEIVMQRTDSHQYNLHVRIPQLGGPEIASEASVTVRPTGEAACGKGCRLAVAAVTADGGLRAP
jgi:hypothetical protein